ncbi:hypothetical protein Tco_1539150 [Tanacetum coccineum]
MPSIKNLCTATRNYKGCAADAPMTVVVRMVADWPEVLLHGGTTHDADYSRCRLPGMEDTACHYGWTDVFSRNRVEVETSFCSGGGGGGSVDVVSVVSYARGNIS